MDEFGLKRQPQVVDGENGIRRKLKMFLVFIKVTFF